MRSSKKYITKTKLLDVLKTFQSLELTKNNLISIDKKISIK